MVHGYWFHSEYHPRPFLLACCSNKASLVPRLISQAFIACKRVILRAIEAWDINLGARLQQNYNKTTEKIKLNMCSYHVDVVSLLWCTVKFYVKKLQTCHVQGMGSLVPSLSASQIFIAYSMKNRRGKSGSKRHDDACRNVTNLTSRISLAPMNFVPRHQCLVQTAPNSRTALSKAFTDTPTAIYRRKGTYMYVWKSFRSFYGSPLLLAIRLWSRLSVRIGLHMPFADIL